MRKRSRYSHGGDGGQGAAAAIFVEKSLRRQKKLRRLRPGQENDHFGGRQAVSAAVTSHQQEARPANAEAVALPLPKRPSRRALVTVDTLPADSTAATSDRTGTETSHSSQPTSKSATPALPPSLRNRQWDTDMEQLTRDMNNYTLEMIGRNLAQMQMRQDLSNQDQASQAAAPSEHEMSRLANERRKAAYAKFKPKPGPRYAERHADRMTDVPALGGAGSHDSNTSENANDNDSDDESMPTDDEDYVTETYVRVPGHEAAKEQVGGNALPGSIGLLVFDNEPDLDFFYGVEEDSEEDWEEDEDENAENYYTHDYPEDEVSSDDEYGRDAYHYRTVNATDLEEFESDDEGGATADGNGDKTADGVTEFLGNMKLTKPGDF